MKIALAQLNYHIGNFEANTKKIIQAIHRAEAQDSDLIVFAELSIGGYPAQDFLEFDDFITLCEQSLAEISTHCYQIGCIIGTPVRNRQPKGKPLFNAAAFCYQGKVQYYRKALLPNYDVFDEYRYFEPARDFELLYFKGVKIALTICEDIWDVGNNRLYTTNPMEILSKDNPDLMINIAASPFHAHQATTRLNILKANVLQYKIPLIYVNQVGAQTELLFDGGSLAFGQNASVAHCLPFFEESIQIVDFEALKNNDFKQSPQVIPEKIALIHQALVMGVRDYFQKMGFSKALLGLSGGIDSAVTMVIAAQALGPANVLGVLMPSQFSSDHSINDAHSLAKNLGSPVETIGIESLYHAFTDSLNPLFDGKPVDVTEENIQARIRGVLLMALSNKFGSILLNTSNKSEAAVGYGTLYGDMNGGLSVLGDVFKTEVFALAQFINRAEEIIPIHTITKPPSAELRFDQKDSDSLPEYELLDALLYQYIDLKKGPQALKLAGFDEKMIRRVLRLVNMNEHKRKQSPPVLRVSSKAFGMGRRIPIVANYLM